MARRTTSLLNRLLALNGLAIVAVVAHHAVDYSRIAMVWWADRYRPVSVPNYDQLDSLFFGSLMVVSKLTAFAVPAFLFVSGVFATFMLRGGSDSAWKRVWSRLQRLLIPYGIWQVLYAIFRSVDPDNLSGELTWRQFARDVVMGGRFWYVRFLCLMYLLSPILIGMAKRRARLLLAGSAVLTASVIGAHYLRLAMLLSGADTALADFLITMPFGSLLRYSFYFVVGLVCGLRLSTTAEWTHKHRWHLLGATVLLAALAFFEAQIVYQSTEWYEWRISHMNIPSVLYAASFISCFLGFSEVRMPGLSHLSQVGKASLGIYLMHRFVLEFAARALQKFAPWALAYLFGFYSLLVVSSVVLPYLLMRVTAKSPARRLYLWLFG